MNDNDTPLRYVRYSKVRKRNAEVAMAFCQLRDKKKLSKTLGMKPCDARRMIKSAMRDWRMIFKPAPTWDSIEDQYFLPKMHGWPAPEPFLDNFNLNMKSIMEETDTDNLTRLWRGRFWLLVKHWRARESEGWSKKKYLESQKMTVTKLEIILEKYLNKAREK